MPRPCLYTRLIDAHTKGRDMAASRKVFDGMLCPGVASRNALLISYAKNKIYLKALSVFREVAGQGWEVLLDQVSVSPGMGACGKLWSCSMLWIAGMVSCSMMCPMLLHCRHQHVWCHGLLEQAYMPL